MEREVLKELLYDLSQVISILGVKDDKDLEQLKELSDHAIEDVAVKKDLDLISITVLIYSLYKIVKSLSEKDYNDILAGLNSAYNYLQQRNLGAYNTNIRKLYEIIHKSDAKVTVHLQDVMDAARIKKGTVLLEHGLSMGQAAGLMGLSNWDLQQYAGKTTALNIHDESVPPKVRLQRAFKLFGVS